MRTARKRKPVTLRFESLESRALQAVGITPNDTLFPQQWGLSNPATGVDIEAPRAWAISTGNAAIVVADVGSTGINLANPDLASKVWTNPAPNADPSYPGDLHGWNFVSNSPDISDVNAQGNPDGHGTNVAGIIAAASNNGQGVAGVDWASPIMVLKSASVAQDALAVRFAVDHGAKVINASLGYHYTAPVTPSFLQLYDPLYQAIQYADQQGVTVVAAAGNSGTTGSTSGSGQDLATTPVFPAAFRLPNMIAVAAVDSAGNLASYSNYGASTVDLAAPGSNITTTGLPSQGNYINFASGTSFAAPFVSGVAALVAGQHPEYSAEQVVQRVVSTARPLPGLAGKVTSGGIVDAYLALKAGQTDQTDNSAGLSIAAGATAPTGSFVADSPYVSGGTTYTIPGPNQAIDVSGVAGSAPQAVYRTERYDYAGFTYTIPALTPGAPYTVRLDFSENFYNGPGQRTFNVAINGSPALANFDIEAAAGGMYRAVSRTLNASADSSGTITIAFVNTTPGNVPGHDAGGAKVDGIVISPGSFIATAPVPTPPPPAASNADLALGRPAFASSVEGPGYAPGAAVDGNPATRWSSGQWMQPGPVGWIYVDLGSPQPIGDVRLNWETAYGVDYQIQASNDASSWTTIATVAGNRTPGLHDSGGLSETARYVRVYCTRTSDFSFNYSLYDFSVFAASPTDLAQGRPAVASSSEGPGFVPGAAVDGNASTRWSSGQWMQSGYVGWLYVDLGSSKSIGDVRLNWEAAFGVDYQIQVSSDAANWTTVASVVGNASAGLHDYPGLAATGRYVRVYGTRTSQASDNYSLYDLDIYA